MSAGKKRMEVMGGIVGGIIAVAVALAVLYPFRHAGEQSLDAWSRSYWMLVHRHDEQAFPAKAELCAAPFCTRADTEPKYAGGNPGHRSETALRFCPLHSSGLPRLESRHDDLLRFIYWVLAMLLSWLEAALVLTAVLCPLTFIAALCHRDRARAGLWTPMLEGAGALAILVGAVATIIAWVTFAWW